MIISLELVLAVVVGFIMAWAVGANDVANAMASTVGSKTLTVRSAVIIAAVFEAIGAICASGQVTNMIRYGIIDVQIFANQLDHFILGMLSSLMSAASWLLIATHFGWPVSTTHSIIGAVLGFGVVSIGFDHILWWSVFKILLSWILTPVFAVMLSYVIFILLGRLVFSAKDPISQANWLIPTCMTLLVFIFSGVTIFQGLDVIGVAINDWHRYVVVMALGGLTFIVGWLYTHHKLKKTKGLSRQSQMNAVENKFGILSIMTAASMAFAHGSNDVANAIGPVAAVVQVLQTQSLQHGAVIPPWVVFLGASGIVLGLMMYGYKIMETVGVGITQLTPSRGFTAQFSTSVIIVMASGLGYPVSTTQTMVGAILGVGLARGMAALNLTTIKKILVSWLITVPVGAAFSSIYYSILTLVF